MKVFIVVNTVHIFEEVLNQIYIQHLFSDIFAPKLFSGGILKTGILVSKQNNQVTFENISILRKEPDLFCANVNLFEFVQQILG